MARRKVELLTNEERRAYEAARTHWCPNCEFSLVVDDDSVARCCDCGGPLVPQSTSATAPHESVLSEAARLVDGDRQAAYGHPKDNHACTAALWNAWLERRYNALHDRDGHVDIGSLLDARAVCWLNILQKASRDAHSPSRDNAVDVAGFAANIGMLDEA